MAKYPEHKKAVLDLVPQKGYWRNLPLDIQKEYMGKSFYLSEEEKRELPEELGGTNQV